MGMRANGAGGNFAFRARQVNGVGRRFGGDQSIDHGDAAAMPVRPDLKGLAKESLIYYKFVIPANAGI